MTKDDEKQENNMNPDEGARGGGVVVGDATNLHVGGNIVGGDIISTTNNTRIYVGSKVARFAIIGTLGLAGLFILFAGVVILASRWPFLTTPTAPPIRALRLTPAAPGETLVIIAAFDRSYANKGFDAPDRIYGLIMERLPVTTPKMRVEKYPDLIRDQSEARTVLADYGARLVIWGWYDDAGAQANIELSEAKVFSVKTDFNPATPDSFHFTNVAAQASYLTFFSLGMMQLDANRPAATELFTSAIESARGAGSDANPWEALMWRGNIYALGQERGLAVADYTEALRLHPHREGYFNRGLTYREDGQNDPAIADYTKAIEIDPAYTAAFVSRGNSYRSKGQYSLALADYTRAIEIDPAYTPAYVCRGVFYGSQGQYNLAIDDYTKVLEMDPNNMVIYRYRGDAYYSSAAFDRAIIDYDKALAIDAYSKDAFDAFVSRGNALYSKGEYGKAIADYTKALEIDPNSKLALVDRGDTYRMQGEYGLAAIDYGKAIQIDPTFATAFTGRGNINATMGKFPEAIADYLLSISLQADSYTYCVLGITYTKISDFQSAITALEKGVALDSKVAYKWCETALNDARLGKPTP